MLEADVSVVIVNWNTRQLLLDVIASLQENTRSTTLEIIVVDNGSSDGSADAVAAAFSAVKVIRNSTNLGFAKANNIGFAAATGRALCLVNTDVECRPGVIDQLWQYLLANDDVGLVGPRTLHRDGRVRLNCRRFPTVANALGDHLWLKKLGIPALAGRALSASTYATTHRVEVLSGCFLMVRREAFAEVGPLDEDFFFYGEDTDWGLRFHRAGWGAVYLAEAEAVHFGGGSSAALPVTYYLVMEKSDLLYWRKHHSGGERLVYLTARLIHNVVSVLGWAVVWMCLPKRRAHAALKVRGNAINSIWLLTRRSLVHTPGWS